VSASPGRGLVLAACTIAGASIIGLLALAAALGDGDSGRTPIHVDADSAAITIPSPARPVAPRAETTTPGGRAAGDGAPPGAGTPTAPSGVTTLGDIPVPGSDRATPRTPVPDTGSGTPGAGRRIGTLSPGPRIVPVSAPVTPLPGRGGTGTPVAPVAPPPTAGPTGTPAPPPVATPDPGPGPADPPVGRPPVDPPPVVGPPVAKPPVVRPPVVKPPVGTPPAVDPPGGDPGTETPDTEPPAEDPSGTPPGTDEPPADPPVTDGGERGGSGDPPAGTPCATGRSPKKGCR